MIIVATALQAALQIQYYPEVWLKDVRFWSTVSILVSLFFVYAAQYVEHDRSRVPNGVVLFYWLFFIGAYGYKLYSLVAQDMYEKHLAYFVAFSVSTGLAIVEFVLELFVDKAKSEYQAPGVENECPYEHANVFSVLTYGWMTPLMKYGYHKYLRQEDLWSLRHRDKASTVRGQFEEAWEAEHETQRPSLWFAIFRGYGGPFIRAGIFKTGSDFLAFVQPQLLKFLISFVQSYSTNEPEPVSRGAIIALGMFAVSVAQTVFLHQYFGRAFETGMRVKSGLTAAIYRKSLRLSNEGRAAKSTGDIVNYMAVDTQRLQDLSQFGQMLWSAPLQIVLCMVSLYQLLGMSMLAGVAIMVIMIPINGLIAKFMKSLQKRQMKTKDARSRLMTEILNNMKSIKLYAWTSAFSKKLNEIRNDQELRNLRQIGAAQAFANFTWSTTPFLVSCSTFVVFVLTNDRPLSTDIIFPALTLFNLLTFPLTMLPSVITAIIEASVAVNRLTAYLNSEEIQTSAVMRKPAATKVGEETVKINNGTFSWNRYEDRLALEDVEFSTKKGDLTCIVGRVGAGKSSFLESILGNLYKTKGEVAVKGAVAYVAQSSWIMNATVKENILFGHKWDADFYDKTVKACALLEDFNALPDGDRTEVGERGISLSGGQKARVTLARAVYARADVYLLDDVLSAVDGHVGRHIIENVLGVRGLLNGKTRILATNAIPVLSESSQIILIESGKITESGTYDSLLARGGGVADFIRTAATEEENKPNEDDEKTLQGSSGSDNDVVEEVEATEDMQDGQVKSRPGVASLERKESVNTLRRASTASFSGLRGKLSDEDAAKSSQTKETTEQGKVKWSVYAEYAKTSNLVAVFLYLAMIVGAKTAETGGSVWLKIWAEANQSSGRNPDVAKYIGIYFAFGVGSAALTVLQTLILWIFCSIEVCRLAPKSGRGQLRLIDRLGLAQAARAHGICHVPVSDELL